MIRSRKHTHPYCTKTLTIYPIIHLHENIELKSPTLSFLCRSICWFKADSENAASQRALQGVVIVFEALELQKVFGSLTALPGGGKVGDLDGGGGAADWGAGQVLGCRLVVLIQAGAAGVGLHNISQLIKSLLIFKKFSFSKGPGPVASAVVAFEQAVDESAATALDQRVRVAQLQQPASEVASGEGAGTATDLLQRDS